MTHLGTVIFDLDGTLVDSAPDLSDALDTLLSDHGHAPLGLDVARSLIGHGIATLVQRGFARCGVDLAGLELAATTERFLKIYNSHLSRKTRPYPGAIEAIDALRAQGWRLAVCTNKLEVSARGILQDLELIDQFSVVAGPDTFGVAKPDPGHLLNCLDAVDRARPAIVVGDSDVDCAAARAAGLPVIAVSWGYAHSPVEEMGADAVLINTAIAVSDDPVRMAKAFASAVDAGRAAYELSTPALSPRRKASATSPLTAFLDDPASR